uniref:ORF75B n=1 Tax=Oryza sativa subsp. japonica TaxID=39947 RepID=Q35304_ORYSJ|nr:ORF75B [Oryza sativa Japonica Group]
MPTKTSHQVFLFGDNSRYARRICMQCLGVVRWCVLIANRLTLSLYKLHFSQRKEMGMLVNFQVKPFIFISQKPLI